MPTDDDTTRRETALGEATIDQIMAELYTRTPAMIAVIAVPDTHPDSECETREYGVGNRHTRLGYASMYAEQMKKKLLDDSEPHDPRVNDGDDTGDSSEDTAP